MRRRGGRSGRAPDLEVRRCRSRPRDTGYERFNAVPHENLSIPATRFTGAARSSCIE
jgi:hypothetical protein